MPNTIQMIIKTMPNQSMYITNSQIYKVLARRGLISAVYLFGIRACRVHVCLMQKRNIQLSSAHKVEGLYIYPPILFKNILKNSIKIHKNFIDLNSEKFKNNFKNIQY
jgi:hypothetical protein